MKTNQFRVRAVWHDPLGNTFVHSLETIPGYLRDVAPDFYAIGQTVPGTNRFDWDECREYTEKDFAFEECERFNEEDRLLESYETELDEIRKL